MKKRYSILFCISLITLVGCEDLLDCIINRSPELPEKYLESGRVGYVYFQEITAGIKNEPRDDIYDYNFEIYGDIPDGLEVSIDFRTLFIEGTPNDSGRYEFTIALNVGPPEYYDEETEDYENSMCSTSTSMDYEIIIN
ncbi:hypothetical protein [Lacinutrix mariniflava]|uniref:hypothetical protein n=1 Tax=Lacinutrix mariniflava TaxID=342955 RepID=UPI0006E32769|nr:hypothetical protein [Lacinutrix mariniflava]